MILKNISPVSTFTAPHARNTFNSSIDRNIEKDEDLLFVCLPPSLMPNLTVIRHIRSQPWGYGHHPRGSRTQQRIHVDITRPLISTQNRIRNEKREKKRKKRKNQEKKEKRNKKKKGKKKQEEKEQKKRGIIIKKEKTNKFKKVFEKKKQKFKTVMFGKNFATKPPNFTITCDNL